MIHEDILGTIGRTPVVRLRGLSTANGTEILVKLEGCNPGGSIKDRAALAMIEAAEKAGRLAPGDCIVESTSGNLGRALALIGAAKGYRVILVVDPKAPRSMIHYAQAMGAIIDMVELPDETGGYQRPRMRRVQELLSGAEGRMFWPDQYSNPENPRVHATNTAEELLSDVERFDTLVAAVSTGGHISGLSTTLKRQLPDLVTVAVDPVGSAVFGFPTGTYAMRGLGLAWRPENLDTAVVDAVHRVTDREGMATARLLARLDGLFVGESAGAAVFAALHQAHHHPNSRIVVVAADGGSHYADESYNDTWLAQHGMADMISPATWSNPEWLLAAARSPTCPPTIVEHACPIRT